VALLYADLDQIFFPVYLDWRGRLYWPKAEYLGLRHPLWMERLALRATPQGGGPPECLLAFGRVPCGGVINRLPNGASGAGLKYLKIHGANCFGVNGEPPEEREPWSQGSTMAEP